jgi:hypothetical protein
MRPFVHCPQQYASPSLVNAQVKPDAALMEMKLNSVATALGAREQGAAAKPRCT